MVEKSLIKVCGVSGCKSLKGLEILKRLKEQATESNINVEIKQTGCQGLCEVGPIVQVDDIFYCNVNPEDCDEIIEAFVNGSVVERLLFEQAGINKVRKDDIDFYKYQTRYVTRRVGEINPESFGEYFESEGYKGLTKAIRIGPEKVIDIVKKSGLRGRGGGGFPTGVKWEMLSKGQGEKLLIVNADEGDPGSFMDRTLMEGDPFALIEGLTIAGFATGAKKGTVYVRAEYPDSAKILRHAIRIAKEKNLLGKDILGSGFDFEIDLFLGAGAFVCGEETALMNSIEGKRGMPRPKPPYPAQSGVYGQPTNINNVKTYCYVSHIVREGFTSFTKIGTKESPGTAVLCLTGKVKNTGVVEVPMGTSLRDVVFKVGGGVKDDKKLKAVLTGGPSGGCIPADMLDLGVDFESITKAGSIMGSGGVLILDEDDSMVHIADFFVKFCMAESCGKCTPCREGTLRLHELLDRIKKGNGKKHDIEKLEKLGNYIKENALCGLGMTAPNPVLTSLKHYRDEFENLVNHHRNRVYNITSKCVGCGLCKKGCPVDCISGVSKKLHTIDSHKCVLCGNCYKHCPVHAIEILTK